MLALRAKMDTIWMGTNVRCVYRIAYFVTLQIIANNANQGIYGQLIILAQ
jgi:hypothetical protein